MVTGVEAAGLALAILPLLVNQLDNYVQGLETLKSLRAKRYLRELESYLSNLGAQQVIFLNTLEQAFDGVIEDEYEFRNWIRNPRVDAWVNQAIEEKLQARLGRSFEPFVKTANELSTLLADISRRLGLKDGITRSCDPDTSSSLTKKVKKFRDVFSKSVYADLFARINTTNTILKTLVEQSYNHGPARKRKGASKRALLLQRRARKSASSLYNSIMQGECWNCPCKAQHSVRFVLDFSLLNILNMPDETSNPKFRMVFTSRGHGSHHHEVEAESNNIPPSSACHTNPSQPDANQTHTNKKQTKVSFNLIVSEPDPQPTPTEKPPPTSIISDLCSVISNIKLNDQQRAPLGYVTDEKYRHNMYYVRSVAENLQSQSLETIIAASSTHPRPSPADRYIFTRRDRLVLAVNLACSVLQFHGSWLAGSWSARDIMFVNQPSDRVDRPYILCQMARDQSLCKQKTSSALIRNEILFPLGLVLVELSLCQNLKALRTVEDDDALEAVANLKTAARYLPTVEMESGLRYGEVVKQCLFGLDMADTMLEDETAHVQVFESVVVPLVDNLTEFDGKARGV